MSTLKNFNVKSGLSVGPQFIDVIDANGNASFNTLTASNFQVTGVSNLGNVANVQILGGTGGQVLITDGSGNLNWGSAGATPGGNATELQYNNDGVFAGLPVTYDGSGLYASTPIYTYSDFNACVGNINGTFINATNLAINSSGTVDFVDTSSVALGAVGNLHITGGTGGQVLITDGAGNLNWGFSPASTIVNGTSNVAIPTTNGPLSFSVGGTPGVLIVNRISSSINSGLLPQSNNTHNLGNASFRWKDAFFANISISGNITAGNITVANITANRSSATEFFVFPTYTAAAIRAITGQVGWSAAVSDSTPGGKHAYWDTTNARWSYVSDDSAV